MQPKTTLEAMYTNYMSGGSDSGGGCELDEWMEGWRRRGLRAVRSR